MLICCQNILFNFYVMCFKVAVVFVSNLKMQWKYCHISCRSKYLHKCVFICLPNNLECKYIATLRTHWWYINVSNKKLLKVLNVLEYCPNETFCQDGKRSHGSLPGLPGSLSQLRGRVMFAEARMTAEASMFPAIVTISIDLNNLRKRKKRNKKLSARFKN